MCFYSEILLHLYGDIYKSKKTTWSDFVSSKTYKIIDSAEMPESPVFPRVFGHLLAIRYKKQIKIF